MTTVHVVLIIYTCDKAFKLFDNRYAFKRFQALTNAKKKKKIERKVKAINNHSGSLQ